MGGKTIVDILADRKSSMLQKMGTFLAPNKTTVVVFLVLMLALPIFYVYSEPERTNYLPREEQDWIINTRVYPGVLKEYCFHTNGNIDTFFGIMERNYFSNHIGFLLLAVYYLLAIAVNRLGHRIWSWSGFSKAVSEIRK